VSDEHERFIATVELNTGLSRPDAERAARATLETLAERLAPGEARDLAERLPAELAPYLATTDPAEPIDIDEFLRRVAQREQVDISAAERHARAVFEALGRTVGDDEIDDMVAELPHDFAPLVEAARRHFVDLMAAGEFYARVAERAGLDADGARRASDAVLTTLAERIARGEVDDLISRLPVELHRPLRAGDAHSSGTARRMSLDAFLQRIAEREGVTPAEAREHARAVFATLREAVGEPEFLDVTAQLPPEYAAVEARAPRAASRRP
jgi:uncharacterized protein (DUF2267 family)